MGLSKQAVTLVAHGYADQLIALVDMDNIEKAINENDFDLAMANFDRIIPLIMDITPTETGQEDRTIPNPSHNSEFTLHQNNLALFLHFVERVKESGLEYWFKEDPLTHWCNYQDGQRGWEEFIKCEVAEDITK